MALPVPLPDDPRKWDGWRHYSSSNPYEALGFEEGERPDDQAIEAAYRELLQWWQKKLPLRSQPGNPLSQLLRPGLDEAPQRLSLARAELLDPTRRAALDAALDAARVERAAAELARYVDFSVHEGVLSRADDRRLVAFGIRLGLEESRVRRVIGERLVALDASVEAESSGSNVPPVASRERGSGNVEEEFLRLLRLARVDEIRMGAREKEAFLNLGESLGLDSFRAEELLEQAAYGIGSASTSPAAVSSSLPPPLAPSPPAPPPSPAPPARPPAVKPTRTAGPVREAPFRNTVGLEMIFIQGGLFLMGNGAPGAPPNERPVTRVELSPFFVSQVPVTNAQFEQFDPDHRVRRLPTADERHPVVFVSYAHAQAFCRWLSQREGRRCRLPTEAEWEYVAKGGDDRPYPWGRTSARGDLANFADRNTRFAWSDPSVDDGFAFTSPVGHYPLGASPFGVLDLAGNVWEWCLDGYGLYPGGTQRDPQGVRGAPKRVQRGGSWRSRFSGITTTIRAFHPPEYLGNDTGFRIVCEMDGR